MSDSFTTTLRLNPTTVTHTIEPCADLTDISQAIDYLHPPSFPPSSTRQVVFLPLTPRYSTSTIPRFACFPIPHSTLVVARTPREEVTNRSRVSQDPANPSWYKIAPRGSQPDTTFARRIVRPCETDTPAYSYLSAQIKSFPFEYVPSSDRSIQRSLNCHGFIIHRDDRSII